jgi:hypothetical protein
MGWIAYTSNESGISEVYVRPFPGPGAKSQISSGGGGFSNWSRTKRELFFGAINKQIMMAAYTVDGDLFHAEKPRPWSDKRYATRGALRSFDLHPDGERFALAAADTASVAMHDHVTVMFNVFDELRRIAPVTKR